MPRIKRAIALIAYHSGEVGTEARYFVTYENEHDDRWEEEIGRSRALNLAEKTFGGRIEVSNERGGRHLITLRELAHLTGYPVDYQAVKGEKQWR